MPIVLANLPLETVQAINRLLEENRYSSLEEFVLLSVTNQLAYESGAGLDLPDEGRRPSVSALLEAPETPTEHSQAEEMIPISEMGFAAGSVNTIAPIESHSRDDKLLWAQFYRFLPLKAAIRLLENDAADEWPSFDAFRESVGGRISRLAKALRCLDKESTASRNGLKLAVGFPNDRKPEKSMSRYIEQYVGGINRQGDLYGFGAALGFLAIRPLVGNVQLAVTPHGRDFARIPSPVLDLDDYSQALSEKEVAFLLKHIGSMMPAERQHISAVLLSISEQVDTPAELDSTLKTQYEMWFPTESWSDKKVTSMRSGAISRLREMGLVCVEKEGIRVTYRLAESWREAAAPCLD